MTSVVYLSTAAAACLCPTFCVKNQELLQDSAFVGLRDIPLIWQDPPCFFVSTPNCLGNGSLQLRGSSTSFPLVNEKELSKRE